MADTKHTPGPWSILDERRGFIVTACDDCYDVATVRNIGNRDNAANARLIAAAPDMLAALQTIKQLNDDAAPFGGEIYRDRVDRAWDAVRAAIAKATGEPHA
jgi:hypothetical protein